MCEEPGLKHCKLMRGRWADWEPGGNPQLQHKHAHRQILEVCPSEACSLAVSHSTHVTVHTTEVHVFSLEGGLRQGKTFGGRAVVMMNLWWLRQLLPQTGGFCSNLKVQLAGVFVIILRTSAQFVLVLDAHIWMPRPMETTIILVMSSNVFVCPVCDWSL